MVSKAQQQRERELARSMGMDIAEFRRRYTPWRAAAAVTTKVVEFDHKVSTVRRVVGSKPSAGTKRAVYERDLGLCRYCGWLVEQEGSRRFTVDHVLPRSRGGTGDVDNLVCACAACNSKKGDRTPLEAKMALLPIGTVAGLPAGPLPRITHLRNHWRRDGQPKRSYTMREAVDTAARLTEQDGVATEPFRCPQCSAYHVRIVPRVSSKNARAWHAKRLPDEVYVELGERVASNLRGENVRARRERRRVLASRARRLGRSLSTDVAEVRGQSTAISPW